MRVRDVMTQGVIAVHQTASLAEAVETLLRSRISALFVLDANSALVGVLSEGDLMRRSELGTETKHPHWIELLLSGGKLAESYVHAHGRRVGEIMTADVLTIAEDADLHEAVDLMLRRHINRLPVMRGNAVVGVISRADLLKGLLAPAPASNFRRPDSEIETAILTELENCRWAPRASVAVEVAEGVVTFRGVVNDERQRAGLRVIAENIPGVVAVHDHMCCIEPNSGAYLRSQEDEQARG